MLLRLGGMLRFAEEVRQFQPGAHMVRMSGIHLPTNSRNETILPIKGFWKSILS